MTKQQAPSDPQAEAFMSKMEKELGVKFVDATPKEEYTAEDEAREKDIDWSKAEKIELPNLKPTPSESDWEKRFDKAFSVNVDSDDFEAYPEPSQIKAFIRKVRASAVLEALEKVLEPFRVPTQQPKRYNEYDETMNKFRNEGILEYQKEVLRRVAEIKKEYGAK